MYELNGNDYTLEALQDSAKSQDLDFETFMGVMKNKGLTEKVKVEEPSKASTMLSNLGLSFAEFAQGIENKKEAIQLGVAELLMGNFDGEMSVEEKKGARQAIKSINLGSSDNYDPIISKLEENIPEYETQLKISTFFNCGC